MSKMETIRPPTSAGITCRAGDLRRAVNAASMVVERRNTIPVLGCLRITPLDNRLEIAGTDLDNCLTVTCEATCSEASAKMVDAHTLRALLSGAEDSDTVRLDQDGDILTMQIGPVTIRQRLLIDATDWPDITAHKLKWTTLPEATLAKAIDNVRWAISTEETRYYLNGIYFHGRDGRLAATATDGHRIAIHHGDAEWPLPDLIFPRQAVAALRRMLTSGGNQEVRIGASLNPLRMEFQGIGWTMVCTCIDGTYPDYSRVIPDRSKVRGHAVINKAMVRRFPALYQINALREALVFDLPKAVVTMKSISLGLDISTPAEAQGDFVIGFNQRYIRDIVQNFGTVRIEAIAPGDAAFMLTEDPDLTIVLMPMRAAG